MDEFNLLRSSKARFVWLSAGDQTLCEDGLLLPLMAGIHFGGAEGTRTPDLDSAIVALSQLSYSPAPDNGFVVYAIAGFCQN